MKTFLKSYLVRFIIIIGLGFGLFINLQEINDNNPLFLTVFIVAAYFAILGLNIYHAYRTITKTWR